MSKISDLSPLESLWSPVIAHDHVGMDAPTGLLTGLPEAFFESFARAVGGENIGAVVASVDHMVKGTLVFNAQLAGHGSGILPTSGQTTTTEIRV